MKDGMTNIGEDGAKVRIMIGVIFTFFSLFLPILLIGLEQGIHWRALLVLPSWGAILSFLQARSRVCFFLGRRNQCDFGQGHHPVDSAMAAPLRRRGNIQALIALVGALAYTAIIISLPQPRLDNLFEP
jgi:hypothetical protein